MPSSSHYRTPLRMLVAALLGILAHIHALADSPAVPADSKAAIGKLEQDLRKPKVVLSNLLNAPFANVPLTKPDATNARKLLWQAHVAAITRDRAEEIKKGVLVDGKLKMPFSITKFGKPPKAGYSLWISLHGGGGTTAAINDSQWENQKRLYRLDEGIYVAPRAPTDTWNLWHQEHIDRLFARLIEDLIVLEHVDPNRIYVLGYSAGGDGVYQLAPRMADRWAGAAMMAGHPNDASPLGLRNVAFALQVGGNDAGFDRNKVAWRWAEELDRLQQDDRTGYKHFVKIHEGKGHWMDREDAVALPWLAKCTRAPIPDRIVWKQSTVTHNRFYWLAVPPGEAKTSALVIATLDAQRVDLVSVENVQRLLVRFTDGVVDLDRPVQVRFKGRVLFDGLAPRTLATLVRTLDGYGDRHLLFDAEVDVKIPSAP